MKTFNESVLKDKQKAIETQTNTKIDNEISERIKLNINQTPNEKQIQKRELKCRYYYFELATSLP